MKKQFRLSVSDRSYLQDLLKKGSLKVKILKRAQALLLLDQSQSPTEVGRTLGMDYQAVSRWRTRYLSLGLVALEDKARSGRPVVMGGEQRAKITALACSTPPEGHSLWSLRLLSDKAVELGFVEQISHTQVGKILKKTS